MTKIEVIMFRNEHSLEEQQRWWVDEHAPLGKKMPGLRSYTINLAGRGPAGEEPEICGTAVLVFDSPEAAAAAFASDEGKAAGANTRASGSRGARTWIAREVAVLG